MICRVVVLYYTLGIIRYYHSLGVRLEFAQSCSVIPVLPSKAFQPLSKPILGPADLTAAGYLIRCIGAAWEIIIGHHHGLELAPVGRSAPVRGGEVGACMHVFDSC